MTTTVRPSRVRGTLVSRSSAIRTPAARHLSTIARCQSTVNHSVSAAAIVGPTPSTAASRSVEADMMASRSPNSVARARAAVGPTWRMDNATKTRHSAAFLALSRLSSSRLPLADKVPALVRKSSVRNRSSSVSVNRSPSSAITSALSSAMAAS